ncbi:MAG: alpha/beta fold hydrolase [Phycisphaera sp. TMED24]|jgi:pimeloyl-ACP methyl ester carboxylesterase|nr:MAG: alpha/beta fold hydrolase [Phycisphaera sp. TMED24]
MPDLGQLPSAVRERATLTTLGPAPALVVLPESSSTPPPVLLWLHGRQANKEIDPGRALRLLRAGIGFIGVDLPGHGERTVASYQTVEGTLQTILEMSQELDDVHAAMVTDLPVNPEQIAIGGMSAGGMAAAHRLVTPHPYQAMLMEASTGNWAAQAHRPMFQPLTPEALQSEDPMARLATWTPIPVLAQHSRLDEWIRFEGQSAFLEELREHNAGHPVDLQAYDRTGALKEHIGFGKYGAQAKDLCRDFLLRIFGANSRK